MAAWPSPGLSAWSLAAELTLALTQLLDGPSQLFQTQDVMYTPPLPHSASSVRIPLPVAG